MKFLLLAVTLFSHCYLIWGQAWDQDEDTTDPTIGAQNQWTYVYEGQRIQMHCPAGQVINVNKAFYGVVGPNDKNPICRDFAASTIMKSTCNGKQSCTPVMDNNLFPGTTCRTAHGTQFGSCSFWCSPSPCAGYYCANGGTCALYPNFLPYCKCLAEWSGPRCEVDPCTLKECQNGGECVAGIGVFECLCKEGFTGTYCEIDVNPCTNNPCHNDGTCTWHNQQVSCKCKGKWSGDFCAVSPCEDYCAPGGVCTVDQDTGLPSCFCTCESKGKRCQVGRCQQSPPLCKNGGTCFNTGDRGGIGKCFCDENYAPPYCEAYCEPDE